MSIHLQQLPETRQTILLALKHGGPATIAELASRLRMTREAVRQQLLLLEGVGWIEKSVQRREGASSGGGRPSMRYRITPSGEHLFPKHYDALTMEVLDTVADQFGAEAMHRILRSMTEARVREWEPRLAGMSLTERVAALKGIYLAEDSYMDVEQAEDRLSLVERNCPFYNVASRRPALCSVTVSTLSRLLGYRVVREESFQNGDGRCVFRVLKDQPIDPDGLAFELES